MITELLHESLNLNYARTWVYMKSGISLGVYITFSTSWYDSHKLRKLPSHIFHIWLLSSESYLMNGIPVIPLHHNPYSYASRTHSCSTFYGTCSWMQNLYKIYLTISQLLSYVVCACATKTTCLVGLIFPNLVIYLKHTIISLTLLQFPN